MQQRNMFKVKQSKEQTILVNPDYFLQEAEGK